MPATTLTRVLVAGVMLATASVARADIVDHEVWVANTPPEIIEAGDRAGLWDDYRLVNARTGAPTSTVTGGLTT